MDTLTKLHIEYLEEIRKKSGLASLSAVAAAINVNPSTLNRFGKPGGQTHLGAQTLDKLHTFSGILPPTTAPHTPIINTTILADAIEDVLSSVNDLKELQKLEKKEITYRDIAHMAVSRYKKKSLNGHDSIDLQIKVDSV